MYASHEMYANFKYLVKFNIFDHFFDHFLGSETSTEMGPKTSSTLFEASCVCRKCHFRKTQFSVLRVWADI